MSGGPSAIENSSRKIREAAGLPDDFRPFYSLRHTFAPTLASEGTNLYTVQKLLTQKSPQMTKRYAHLRDEALRKAGRGAVGVADFGQPGQRFGSAGWQRNESVVR